MNEESSIARQMRPSRALRAADYVKIGFLTTLGAMLLGILAFLTWHVGQAALSIIAPFVFATVFALLLDPIVDKLERRMSRFFAVLVVFMTFVAILLAAGVYGIPALVDQITTFLKNAPQYITNLKEVVNNFLKSHPRMFGIALPKNFNTLYDEVTARSSGLFNFSSGKVTSLVAGAVSFLLEAIITLILTFYLLMDIDRLRARIIYLAPQKYRTPLNQYATDIGDVFSSYLRGMLIVSALYGAATMATLFGLSMLHHELAGYALLVGVVGGLLYVVPYVGPLATAIITFLVAFSAGGLGFGMGSILATLILNQVFDGVVTPRVVGGGVGLHPVAAVFALTLGGTLFGLWGLLLSVPIAASIQVILFRLFPKLTTPTPRAFLRAQGIRPEESQSPKVMEGDKPEMPVVESAIPIAGKVLETQPETRAAGVTPIHVEVSPEEAEAKINLTGKTN